MRNVLQAILPKFRGWQREEYKKLKIKLQHKFLCAASILMLFLFIPSRRASGSYSRENRANMHNQIHNKWFMLNGCRARVVPAITLFHHSHAHWQKHPMASMCAPKRARNRNEIYIKINKLFYRRAGKKDAWNKKWKEEKKITENKKLWLSLAGSVCHPWIVNETRIYFKMSTKLHNLCDVLTACMRRALTHSMPWCFFFSSQARLKLMQTHTHTHLHSTPHVG